MTATQSPWAELATSLVRAGEQIDGIASREDTLARADGHAQLGTLLEIALRWHLRGADPDFPRFIEINDTPELADNLFAAVTSKFASTMPTMRPTRRAASLSSASAANQLPHRA